MSTQLSAAQRMQLAHEQAQQQQEQHRYYTQSQSVMKPVVPQDRPLTYQRTSSGYSGRRDDAAVSEEQLLAMRGVSYPGQEWSPRMTGG